MTPGEIKLKYSLRNRETVGVLQFFATAHLHPELKVVCDPMMQLAFHYVDTMADGENLVFALRKLLEAMTSLMRHYMVIHNFHLGPQQPKPITALTCVKFDCPNADSL